MVNIPKGAPAKRSAKKQPSGKNKKEKREPIVISDAEGGAITTPEGLIMLAIAVFFDLIGIILDLFFGLNFISDIFALSIIGSWVFIRGGGMQSFSKKGKKGGVGKQIVGKIVKRFGLTYVIRLIPFIGCILNPWTYKVYKELMGK